MVGHARTTKKRREILRRFHYCRKSIILPRTMSPFDENLLKRIFNHFICEGKRNNETHNRKWQEGSQCSDGGPAGMHPQSFYHSEAMDSIREYQRVERSEIPYQNDNRRSRTSRNYAHWSDRGVIGDSPIGKLFMCRGFPNRGRGRLYLKSRVIKAKRA